MTTPLSSLSFELAAPGDQRYIDGFVAVANAMGEAPQDFVARFFREHGQNFASQYRVGVFPSSDFILRFTNDEIVAIRVLAETDTNVAGMLELLKAEPFVAVDDERLGPALTYLAAILPLSNERVVELTAYERPVPNPPVTEQPGPPGPFGLGPGGNQ